MSSPLVKISDQSWSLSCLCCNCAQEVRDNFKMIIGPAFVEYNHRFTCPYCQTYNQILLSKPMFLQAPDMSKSAPPPPPEEVPSLNSISLNSVDTPPMPEPPRPQPPSFEADIPKPKLPSFEADIPKPPVPQQKRKSAFDEPEDDDVIDSEDLDLGMMGVDKGTSSVAPPAPPPAKQTSVPTPSSDVFPEPPKSGKAPATIKIAGKELPRTYVFAGGGLAIVLLAGLAFMFMGDKTPAPAPAPVQQAQPKPVPPPKPQPQPQSQPQQPQSGTQLVESKMVEIPAGEYMIGRSDGTEYERPVHKVTLKAFSIDVREVTKEEYAKFLEATGRKPPESWEKGKFVGNGREPVTDVDWNDAVEYAKWAGKRLPTEQEWEVAASGKDHLLYPWGNEWKEGKANTKEMGTSGPQPAGVFPSVSPFGLFDTVGNVWEWTASEPTPYPGAGSKVADAAKFRVIRGGAWNEGAKTATTTGRNWIEKDVKSPALGFRCAKDLP